MPDIGVQPGQCAALQDRCSSIGRSLRAHALAADAAKSFPGETRTITLLALVDELGRAGASDRIVIAAVARLVKTGRVKLIGQIRDECVSDL